MQQDQSKDTHYTQTLVRKEQEDAFGLITNVNFGAQVRTQTSFGSLFSSAQFQFGQSSGLEGAQSSAPAKSLGPGDGVTFKNANAIYSATVGYSWGPLGHISVGRSGSEFQYMSGGTGVATPTRRASSGQTTPLINGTRRAPTTIRLAGP